MTLFWERDVCIDLIDAEWPDEIAARARALETELERSGRMLPVQDPGSGFRPLDRHLINWVVQRLATEGREIWVVRGAFPEGAPIVSGSGILQRSHVQIAVRNRAAIQAMWREL